MGTRSEIYSSRVTVSGRSYFFNVKENRAGDVFLVIVESKPNETAGFDRRSVVVFKEDMQLFLKSFEKALSAMEKTKINRPPREKRPEAEKEPGKKKVIRRKVHEDGSFSLISDDGKPEPETKRRTIRVKKG